MDLLQNPRYTGRCPPPRILQVGTEMVFWEGKRFGSPSDEEGASSQQMRLPSAFCLPHEPVLELLLSPGRSSVGCPWDGWMAFQTSRYYFRNTEPTWEYTTSPGNHLLSAPAAFATTFIPGSRFVILLEILLLLRVQCLIVLLSVTAESRFRIWRNRREKGHMGGFAARGFKLKYPVEFTFVALQHLTSSSWNRYFVYPFSGPLHPLLLVLSHFVGTIGACRLQFPTLKSHMRVVPAILSWDGSFKVCHSRAWHRLPSRSEFF